MYLVKKFCDIVGVNYSTLRHYERIGLLKPHQDEENGYRKYTQTDAFRVNVFRYFRSLGYDTKTAIQLVEEPKKELVREKLIEREDELIREMIQTRNQMKAVQRLMEDLFYVDEEKVFRIGTREDMWFFPVSRENDFTSAKYEEVAAWTQYLPLTRYSRHMRISETNEERETNLADYGMSIESKSIYLLTEENKRDAIYIPGGECLYYYSTTLERPITEKKIYDEISEYLEEHKIEIYGDIYIEGLRVWDNSRQMGDIVSIPIISKIGNK